MRPYPLIFDPLLKPRVWGGTRLDRGKPLGAGDPTPDAATGLATGAAIGESWEVADLPESIAAGRNTIANGALAGRTLREANDDYADMIMGASALTGEGGFPLLIKYLDARENLSVQVHPPRHYVDAHPGTHLKSEAWVVIDAEPGAVIYRGVAAGVDPAAFEAHIRDGTVVDDLVQVPVERGACYYLPSGTVHALGRGVFVAEVQTPSDTTFRVYDWGRSGRRLHIAEALECIDFRADAQRSVESDPAQASRSRQPLQVDGLSTTTLLDCEYFGIERVEVMSSGAELPVVTNDMPVIWMVTAGRGSLVGGGVEVSLRPGTTVLIPAALRDGRACFEAGCDLLHVTLPSPIRGMLAG